MSILANKRKLQPNECPHSLYIQNYSTASCSCLCVRKWVFNPAAEARRVQADATARAFIFWQRGSPSHSECVAWDTLSVIQNYSTASCSCLCVRK
ncbi:unnamed protein product [Plutella xylostella]|uniref:(diamondback moth) hypothetical protein n=1 Tax=Plutella xylostella TaxID=51655 RepID=A0A8S4G810_PLUXY|nr:unnamed protein product [Plutella xylostella]